MTQDDDIQTILTRTNSAIIFNSARQAALETDRYRARHPHKLHVCGQHNKEQNAKIQIFYFIFKV